MQSPVLPCPLYQHVAACHGCPGVIATRQRYRSPHTVSIVFHVALGPSATALRKPSSPVYEGADAVEEPWRRVRCCERHCLTIFRQLQPRGGACVVPRRDVHLRVNGVHRRMRPAHWHVSSKVTDVWGVA